MKQLISLFCIFSFITVSVNASPIKDGDLHYTKAGFFDIHVCNWPNRPPFFMVLFSSYDFNNIKSISLHTPDGERIQNLTTDKYRLIPAGKKPEKRVFINQVDAKPSWGNGWYNAKVTMKNGEIIEAKDYVIQELIPIVSKTKPVNNAENIAIPARLEWEAVKGANHYQVFIHDLWDDGKTILTSKLLNKPYLDLPKDLIQPDGWYSWIIHARDTNEHVLLGDFNHGSLTSELKFTTMP